MDFNLMKKIKNVVTELKADLLKMGKELDKKNKQVSQYNR